MGRERAQYFAVAHYDAKHPVPHKDSPPESSIDVFEGASDEQLSEACQVPKRSHAPGGAYEAPFVVLDERSVRDRTVVLHFETLGPGDEFDV